MYRAVPARGQVCILLGQQNKNTGKGPGALCEEEAHWATLTSKDTFMQTINILSEQSVNGKTAECKHMPGCVLNSSIAGGAIP